MSRTEGSTRRKVALRIVQVAASFTVVGVLFAQVLPRVTGTDGHAIWQHLSRLSTMDLGRCWPCGSPGCVPTPGC